MRAVKKTGKMASAIQRTKNSMMIIMRKKPELAWVEHPLTASPQGEKSFHFK